jgi:CRISPR-associated exonuclease Cas4
MTAKEWVVAGAVLALLLGALLLSSGWGLRRRFGLGAGKTVALDNVTLRSRRYGLVCRPDRIASSKAAVR